MAQAAQIRDLLEEVEEKAAGGHQLIEALDSLNKERRAVTNRHEARVELIECQITEPCSVRASSGSSALP